MNAKHKGFDMEKINYSKEIIIDTINNDRWLEDWMNDEFSIREDETVQLQIGDPSKLLDYDEKEEKRFYEAAINSGIEIGTWVKVLYSQ